MTGYEELLTPGEAAAAFHVDRRTVAKWAAAGRLSTLRTLGGHRRYRKAEVDALLKPDAAHHRMSREQAARLLARYAEAVNWQTLMTDRDAIAAAYRVASAATQPDPNQHLAVTAARDRLVEGP